jgi:hypothetical protein
MRVLGMVIEIPILVMLHPGQDRVLCCPIAFQLVGDDHPWHVLQALEQLAKKLLGGVCVATTLDEHIEDGAVLIHRPPQRGALLVHTDKHLEDVSEVLVCYSLGTYESQSNPLLIE